MLDEIEAGHEGAVITKDLSRLGRNSALTGLYINYTFPQNDVRYIAINDHFDSINPNSTDSDIAGIKTGSTNFRQRYKPKDSCGAKARVSVVKIDRPCAIWLHENPENPKEWIIDEEAAQVVKKIFTLCMNGRGPSQIADQLERTRYSHLPHTKTSKA